MTMHLRLASLGFGNVGRALAQMLADKADELQQRYDLTLSFTGICTRSAGAVVWQEGVSAREVAAIEWPRADRQHGTGQTTDALDFIRNVPADVVLELTTLNPQSGQPAIEHIRTALAAGKHVITANKGPI